MKLLVIDEGNGSGALLYERLGESGFRPKVVRGLVKALSSGLGTNASAVLFDHGRPDQSAAASVRPLRESGLKLPLVVLSGRDDWREKVDCLDAGADDFVVKPVRSEEVAARLRAVIRRRVGVVSDRLSVGDIDLDIKAKCGWKAGTCLDLTANEFRLLRLFMLAPEQRVTREQILAAIWGSSRSVTANAVDVQVARLRKKLGEDALRPVRGVGYALIAGEHQEQRKRDYDPEACCKANGCEESTINALFI